MKRNYLYKSYFKRLYTEVCTPELEQLVLEYFKIAVTSKNPNNVCYWSPSYRTIEKYLYYYKVSEETEKNKHLIEGIEFRNKDLHIDHIVPKSYGYENNINPKVIGSIYNLQMLSSRENAIKSKHLTKQSFEIIKKYNITSKRKNKLEHYVEKENVKERLHISSFYKPTIYLKDSDFISVHNLNTGERIKEINIF